VRNENEIMTARNNVMKSSTFVLVPENNFGLTSVYGGKKRAGRKSKDEE